MLTQTPQQITAEPVVLLLAREDPVERLLASFQPIWNNGASKDGNVMLRMLARQGIFQGFDLDAPDDTFIREFHNVPLDVFFADFPDGLRSVMTVRSGYRLRIVRLPGHRTIVMEWHSAHAQTDSPPPPQGVPQ